MVVTSPLARSHRSIPMELSTKASFFESGDQNGVYR